MTKFSTGKVHLIKRFFQTLAQKFSQITKYLQTSSKRIDWMTSPLPRPKGVGGVILALNYWGLL